MSKGRGKDRGKEKGRVEATTWARAGARSGQMQFSELSKIFHKTECGPGYRAV